VTEIHEKIKEAGFDVDRRLIRLEGPIKVLGEHKVEVRLHQDVLARLTVTIQSSESPKKVAEASAPETTKRMKSKKKSDNHTE
jgi:large subunit ribosomal protein L9